MRELLNEDWAQAFSFDEDHARSKAEIILCFKDTGLPIPLKIRISDEALNKGRINWRELTRAIKDCLPEKIINKQISDVKYLLRMASRRKIKDVEQDVLEWLQKTAQLVRQMFGPEKRDGFLVGVDLNTNFKAGSIQSLESITEEKIRYLLELY